MVTLANTAITSGEADNDPKTSTTRSEPEDDVLNGVDASRESKTRTGVMDTTKPSGA
jgi:hypothetical protein